MTTNSLVQYYRCPEVYGRFQTKESFSGTPKYFRFGKDVICYGTYFGQSEPPDPTGAVFDASLGVELKDGRISLPFDPSEVIDNLRCEKYVKTWRYKKPLSILTDIYFTLMSSTSSCEHKKTPTEALSARLEKDTVSALARGYFSR